MNGTVLTFIKVVNGESIYCTLNRNMKNKEKKNQNTDPVSQVRWTYKSTETNPKVFTSHSSLRAATELLEHSSY